MLLEAFWNLQALLSLLAVAFRSFQNSYWTVKPTYFPQIDTIGKYLGLIKHIPSHLESKKWTGEVKWHSNGVLTFDYDIGPCWRSPTSWPKSLQLELLFITQTGQITITQLLNQLIGLEIEAGKWYDDVSTEDDDDTSSNDIVTKKADSLYAATCDSQLTPCKVSLVSAKNGKVILMKSC